MRRNSIRYSSLLLKQRPKAYSSVLLSSRGYSGNSNNSGSEKDNPRILITGALGQIGTELTPYLRNIYGAKSIIATDVRRIPIDTENPYKFGNVLDSQHLEELIIDNNIDWIIHNVSILSAAGERDPTLAMEINVTGINNILELGRKHHLRIFAPSSIAAFGPTTPRDNTPDLTVQRPSTMYGVTKVYLELMGEYYNKKYGVDFRSLRYPGILSYVALPGGGTTDYAVEIFYKALQEGKYTCFLRPDTKLPMMYMSDCIKGTVDLMRADNAKLSQRVYNLGGISFSCQELVSEIQKWLPDFRVEYKEDFRQHIADSWPRSLDDSTARQDWGWKSEFGLEQIVKDMLDRLSVKLGVPNPTHTSKKKTSTPTTTTKK